MNTFITSDIHLSHPNIIKFCPKTRGHYKSVSEMNEDIILRWNAEVTSEDTVFILGDVSFADATTTVSILSRLNGKKILIVGNHDKKLLKDQRFRAQFEKIYDYYEENMLGLKVVMFHYPIVEYNQQHRGAVHFHGHLHQNPSGLEKYRVRNVGFDYTGKVVWKIEDAIADALKGEIKTHGSGD